MAALLGPASPLPDIATSLPDHPSRGSIRTRRSALRSPNRLLRELDLVHRTPRIAPPPNPQLALTRRQERLQWMESVHLSWQWSLPAAVSRPLAPKTNPL